MRIIAFCLALLLIGSQLAIDCESANGKFLPVALTGDTLAGTSFLFDTVNGPISMNRSGQTAFAGTISGYGIGAYSSSAIFTEGSGPGIAVLAQENTPVPTLGNQIRFDELASIHNSPSIPKISDTGDTFFTSRFRGINEFGGGLFRASAGSTALEHVAVWGDQASGFDPSITFTGAAQHSLNSAGDITFVAGLAGDPINALTNSAIYKSAGGINNLEVVIQKWDPIPGLPGQVMQSLGGVNLSDDGTITLPAGRNPQIILSDRGGSGLVPLVAAGDPIEPGISVQQAGRFSTNQAQDVFFSAQLTGSEVAPDDSHALLKYTDRDGLEILLREGEAVAGFAPGTVFSRENSQGPFTRLSANNLGQVVLVADLWGGPITPPTRRVLLFRDTDGQQQVLARIGDEVPGADPGVQYHLLYPSDINERGQVYFRAQLRGEGVEISNDRALFGMDTDGVVKMLLREGDTMDVSRTGIPDLRIIDSLYEGRPNDPAYLNDSGQVAFKASFVDGTQGVFITNVGETSSGDFDLDTNVDGRDFLHWQRNLATAVDLTAWQSDFGIAENSGLSAAQSIPEPSTGQLVLLSVSWLTSQVLRRRRSGW